MATAAAAVLLCTVVVLVKGLPTETSMYPWGQSPHRPLTFAEDGTFQISIFEDLHFGENAWEWWGPAQDAKSLQVMNTILDAEHQDLVVLNGDLITGENTYLENSTAYVDQLVSPMVFRNIPWASTYGNHDSQYNLSRSGILAREQLYHQSLTTSHCPHPYHSCAPALIIWFFDSRGGFHHQQTSPSTNSPIPQPNWVDPSVVAWFTSTSAYLHKTYNRTIPSLAFVHIPPTASLALQSGGHIDPHTEPGINDDVPLAAQGQGWCNTTHSAGCSYGGQDVSFMRAVASTPGLIALFSGHDHGDSWCVKWTDQVVNSTGLDGGGVDLCFGQRSGYGGYGSWMRGSRQVLVTEAGLSHGGVESWVRWENREVVGRVGLNGTFGRDRYERVLNLESHLED